MDKKKILIVDDDSHIAELISLYLTKECFQCEMAGDGETALSLHETFKPDLILLDIMLPGMDGYAVCREIRRHSATPIIMLSAKGEVFDRVLGLELGADDYIIKPFDTKEMVARVKAVLRRCAPPETPPVAGSAGQSRFRRPPLPGPVHQPGQLRRHLFWQAVRYAAQGTGTPVFPRLPRQPGLYEGTASRPHLGL